MAVAFDTVQSVVESGVASGTTLTTPALTISAAATLAIAFVEISGPSDATQTGMGTFTLGGQAFTHLAGSLKHSGSDTDISGFVDIWYLINPPTGSQTATAAPTYTGGFTLENCILTVATFTGTDTSSPFGTAQTANGKLVASLTLTDTLASGDMLVGIACNGTTSPTVSTGTTILSTTGNTGTAAHNVDTGYNTGTGSVSLVFATNSGDWEAASGVKILAGGPAGSGGPAPWQQLGAIGDPEDQWIQLFGADPVVAVVLPAFIPQYVRPLWRPRRPMVARSPQLPPVPDAYPAITRPALRPPARGARARRATIVHAFLQPPPPRPPDAPSQVRRLRGLLAKRPRTVHAFLRPPPPRAPDAPTARRIRGALPRRARYTEPVWPQVQPAPAAFPSNQYGNQPKRLRALGRRRGRYAEPPWPQSSPPTTTPPKRRTVSRKRTKYTEPVWPQVQPAPAPYPSNAAANQPRRLRGLFVRRGRYAEPVWPQVQPPPAAFPSNQFGNQPRRLRGALVRRARRADVPLTQAVPPPARAPDWPLARRVRGALARRPSGSAQPPLEQWRPPDALRSTRRAPQPRRRTLRADAPSVQASPPPALTSARARRVVARWTRRADVPLGQVAPPPLYPPATVAPARRRGILARRTRRADVPLTQPQPPPPLLVNRIPLVRRRPTPLQRRGRYFGVPLIGQVISGLKEKTTGRRGRQSESGTRPKPAEGGRRPGATDATRRRSQP